MDSSENSKNSQQNISKNFLEMIPKEILASIFTHLDPLTLVYAMSVCKKWRRCLEDDRIWQSIYEHPKHHKMLSRGALQKVVYKEIEANHSLHIEGLLKTYLQNTYKEENYGDEFEFLKGVYKGFLTDKKAKQSHIKNYQNYLGYWTVDHIKEQLTICISNCGTLRKYVHEDKINPQLHQTLIILLLKLKSIEEAITVPLLFYKTRTELLKSQHNLEKSWLASISLNGYLVLIERMPLPMIRNWQKATNEEFLSPIFAAAFYNSCIQKLAEAIAGSDDEKWLYIFERIPYIIKAPTELLIGTSDQVKILLPILTPIDYLNYLLNNNAIINQIMILLGEKSLPFIEKYFSRNHMNCNHIYCDFHEAYATQILSNPRLTELISDTYLERLFLRVSKKAKVYSLFLQVNEPLIERILNNEDLLNLIIRNHIESALALIDYLILTNSLSAEIATDLACSSKILAKKLLSLTRIIPWKISQLEKISGEFRFEQSIQLLFFNQLKSITHAEISHQTQELSELTEMASRLLRR